MIRRPIFYAIVVLLLLTACKQGKQYHDQKAVKFSENQKIASIQKFQYELNTTFKNPETSPLPDKPRKDFKSLDFFPPDTNYIIKARFERTPNAEPFVMPTTTSRKSREVVFGIARFELNGKNHQLEVYKSLDSLDDMDEDYLFLPFLDETNGLETYGGGRYIDLTIPESDTLIIDFNRAYNPYCVYNKKYSCPLVPRQNKLKTKVVAGVKDFQTD